MMPFQASAALATPLPSAMDMLNAVTIQASQLQAALERLSALPAHLRDNPAAQARVLQLFAEDEGFSDDCASAALHARATALAKWTVAHDPLRQSDAEAVIDAAARFPLTEDETGVAFEAAGFQELILFIEDLPW